ncbi:multiple sugar transport system substrate-binding protein [Pullulanibacillus pueri]|uniref:Sugar ABC transporter substrate-binding protein n=1 Tax=Pullulanibacillus pueri TaxID=1437324 RepID=A0A8J2ZUT6_9BACL|nr:extracellular solute-binding protein [Pullulanibacillus pueri]MBM7681393.1 multiple sugar transport system substrate-binding protein [Pullulanibacillus pueri]GGH78702.1 sugar ABC transporter substrate-binding protein [Pullulanibacillus pueri]
MKKLVWVMAFVLTFSFILTGCQSTSSKGSGRTVVIKVGFSGTEFTDAEIAAFNKTHKKVQIKYIDISSPGKLQALLASGNAPDIIRIQAASQLGNYINKGIAMDLQSYFDKDPQFSDTSTFMPVAKEYQYDKKTGKQGTGDYYGFAKDWSQDFAIWINKAIFKKEGVPLPSTTEPMTWDEVFSLAKQLTKINAKGAVTQYGLGYYNNNTMATNSLMLLQLAQLGESPWKADFGKANFESPTAIRLLERWVDVVKANLGPNPLNQDPNSSTNLFVQGKQAMLISGYWYSGMLRGEIGKKVDGKPFDINNFEMIPAAVEAGGTRINPTGAAVGGIIYSGTKHPDQAWEVFKYLFGGEPADDRAKSGWGLPAWESKMSELPNKTAFDQQVLKVQTAELEYASPILNYNPFLDLTAVNTVLSKYMIPVYYGKDTVPNAAKKIDKALNALIKQGKQDLGIK